VISIGNKYEFEFLAPAPNDPVLVLLAQKEAVNRKECREMLPLFRERIIRQFEKDQDVESRRRAARDASFLGQLAVTVDKSSVTLINRGREPENTRPK
jgi:hypothetical protein